MEVAGSAGCEDVGIDAPAAGTSNLEIDSGGSTRSAVVRVPDGDGPHPLLVSMHPFTGNPRSWEDYSGLADAAVDRGYVVATPLGSEPGPRWAVPGGLETGADDIGFIADLADHLEDTLCIDRNAEFAAGYSAGAAMAQAMSCTMPWRFAAVAGSGGTNLTETCPASPPTDVFVIHGSVDPIAPLSGSEVIFAPPLGLEISEVVATNAARAGCDPTPIKSAPVDKVEAADFEGCDDDQRVRYWKMRGGGHTWAGTEGSVFNDLIVGPTLQTFSATDEVLDFFDAR
ncbi:MAG: alpha/beta hydrolase family esterase [Microthrixaceae bacterium]